MNPSMQDVEDARIHLKKVNEWLNYLDENGLGKPEKYIADQVITFDAGHRIGIIWIEREECCSCHQRTQCVVVDQSEGEYLQGIICFECINLLRRATL